MSAGRREYEGKEKWDRYRKKDNAVEGLKPKRFDLPYINYINILEVGQ